MNNIVHVTFDSLRADHCTHHGYHRDTTPTLLEMANEGVHYTNAVSPAEKTNPSMSSIVSGEPMVCRDDVADPSNSRNHLQKHGTIAEDLSRKGYTTIAICPNAYASQYYGFDYGFTIFEDFLFSGDSYEKLFDLHLNDSSFYTLARNLRNFIKREEAFRTWDTYIDQINEIVDDVSGPFYLWVFSMDTHIPFLTPRSHRQWSNIFDQYYRNWIAYNLIGENDAELKPNNHQKITDIYDDSLYFGDDLLRTLKQDLAEYNPTFVVHGDHGESLGEHGRYGHFYPSLYEENTHVPLVVWNEDINTEVIADPMILTNIRQMTNELATDEYVPMATTSKQVVSTTYNASRNLYVGAARSRSKKLIVEITPDSANLSEYNISSGEDIEVEFDESFEPLLNALSNRIKIESDILTGRQLIKEGDTY